MDNFTRGMSEKLVLYLDGELSGAEQTELEQQLATDSSLQDEFNRLKSTREAVRLYGMQQKVSGIHRQIMEELQSPVNKINPAKVGSAGRFIRNSMAIAASLLLLIVGYMAYNFFTLSPDKIFNSKYQSYELGTVRSDSATETSVEKTYRAKEYTEVSRIYEAGEDKTQKGKFLAGISFLELNNAPKAIHCFNEMIAANKQASASVMNDEAEYYLALSYIRNRDYDFALVLLNKIHNDPGHLYHDKITGKLIRQVKMLKWR